MSESRGARRLRGVLLACQVALSLILVTGAGLLARNAAALASAPLGVTPDGVLVAGIQLPSSRYPGSEKATAFYRTLEDDVRAVPGVVAVATVSQLPSSTMSANALTVEGRTTTVDTPTFIPYMSVSDDYFRAVGLQVLQGRTFDAQDGSDAPPAVVVSRTFANRYWDGHAVGKRLRVSPHTSERWGVIIGIVEDVRLDPTRTDIEPLAYGAYRQDQGWVSRTLVVRTTGDPLHLVRPVQAALSRLDPTLPLRNPSPLQDLIDQRLLVQRVPAGLMVGFAVLALLVTAVGVYAMFASMTAARLQEFGIRLALGAGRGSIARLVFQQGAVWMAAGVAGGIAAMIAILPVVRSVASAPSSGGLPLVIGLGLILGSAGLALVVPILRATRVNPIDVLRST